MCWIVLAAISFALFGPKIALAEPTDPCRARLPDSLITAIPQKFAGFRAPFETDNEADDVAYSKQHGGTGCLGVAAGDFYGSKTKQYLLALTSTNSSAGLVVIARRTNNGWLFEQLESWDRLRNRLYVENLQPGRYVRSNSLDDPPPGRDLKSLTCSHAGAGFGETESSETVACLFGKSWLFVQVSD